jgi:hypothetical protein
VRYEELPYEYICVAVAPSYRYVSGRGCVSVCGYTYWFACYLVDGCDPERFFFSVLDERSA